MTRNYWPELETLTQVKDVDATRSNANE